VIWSGVHRSFSELPPDDEGFVHPLWVTKSVERLDAARSRTTPVPSAEYPIVDAILGAWDGRKDVHVLDVGGNLGQLALDVRRRLPGVRTTWTVLERGDLLEAARAVTTLPEDVTFHDTREALAGQRFDVLHLGSVLQYFEDWRGELATLLDAHAAPEGWLVISDAMVADDIESFVTRQSYYERGLRMHLLNAGELLDHLTRCGFTLVLKEPYLTPHTASYYPELDLPPERRIAHPLNLVLRRSA